METNWTKNEFKAYLFLYAANADYIVSDIEKDIIEKLIDKKQYHKIYSELQQDNDIRSIDKIDFTLKKFDYSKKDIQLLLTEVKELFLADGNFNLLEQIMLKSFERIFKKDGKLL